MPFVRCYRAWVVVAPDISASPAFEHVCCQFWLMVLFAGNQVVCSNANNRKYLGKLVEEAALLWHVHIWVPFFHIEFIFGDGLQ